MRLLTSVSKRAVSVIGGVASSLPGQANREARFGPPSRAFTLVELMIAIAIFATVMIAIYSSWSAILRSSKVGLEAAAEAQRERMAVRVLEDSLRALQLFQENIRYYSFLADTSGDDAALSFVSHLPKSFPRSGNFGDQVVRRVTFTVEPGTNATKNLVLRQNPLLFDPNIDEEENPLVLARNVRLFTLEFWGPNSKDWEPEWLYTNQLPKMIRLTLGFSPRNNKSISRTDDLITRIVPLTALAIPRGMQVSGGQPARQPNQNPRTNPNFSPNPGPNRGLNPRPGSPR
jgi:type II secretion system protein J